MESAAYIILVIDKHPGGLFIEPAFSTFAVFVIDFIPQITVVLRLSQSSISLKVRAYFSLDM